ncbi:hypothetical protein TNCV_1749841 [Trichonephila clavipes]|nr:hypothetical protein TNCV_1749841 [Trichonephila clavipes]
MWRGARNKRLPNPTDIGFCFNCQVYDAMAQVSLRTLLKLTISYNSFVRPNFSYAQETTPQLIIKPVAPRRSETSRQTEAVDQANILGN